MSEAAAVIPASSGGRTVFVPRAIDRTSFRTRDPGGSIVSLGGPTMGTTWSVKVATVCLRRGDDLRGAIETRLDEIVAQMSTWAPSSAISIFNSAKPGSWHRLPQDFRRVLTHAVDVARASGGAFDPTAGPLVDVWGFGPNGRSADAPSESEAAAIKAACGWSRLELDADRSCLYQPGGLRLDLSAIAKGYAVDQIAARLFESGFRDFLVEIGGELRGEGFKPDGMPWWVSVSRPAGSPTSAEASPPLIALHGLSIATSGDAFHVYDSGGRRYSHTIDPRSGFPVAHDLASVTVVDAGCMAADAWATALMVLGPDAGFTFATDHSIAAEFVRRCGSGFAASITPALAAMLA